MAGHRRTEIRGAVAAALLNQTDAQDRVYKSRLAPITTDSLKEDGPALMVYVRSEKIDAEAYPVSGAEGAVERVLMFTVEAVVRASEDVDDQLDAMGLQVEAILEDFEVPGFGVAEARLMQTEIDISDAFDVPTGSIALTYAFKYQTAYRDRENDTIPEVILARDRLDAREQLPLHPDRLTLSEEERFLAGG